MVQKSKMDSDKKHVDHKKDESEKNIVHQHNTKTGKKAVRVFDPSGLPKLR